MFLISFIISFSLSAQTANNDLIINIRGISIFRGNYLLINIYKHRNSIKILYELNDSVSYQMMLNNKKFNRTQKGTVGINKDSVDKRYKRIYGDGPKYKKDSLLISTYTYPLYTKLLKEISSTSTRDLENKEINRNGVTIDGTHFYFNIKSGKTERKIYANAPDSISQPKLYKLIHQTLYLFEKDK
ncbi:MAG: hypothetical protein JST50_04475 [Bacteroidetes bacterium]|jgi:hypothetical protein|nr:hypothetical protein [Bacteroidota bacterium]